MISTENQTVILDALTRSAKRTVTMTFPPFCGEEPQEVISLDLTRGEGIVGVISLIGTLSLSFLIGLPRQTAEGLAQRFAGFEIPFDSPDMGDAISELTNVLAGRLCLELEHEQIFAQMALPTVARGEAVEVVLSTEVSTRPIYYNSPEGIFWVQLGASQP